MTVLIDVSFETFNKYLRNTPVFFWLETGMSFVLFKPGDNAVVRTTIAKSDSEKDLIWKEQHLISNADAVHVDGKVDFGSGEDVAAIRRILEKNFGDLNG